MAGWTISIDKGCFVHAIPVRPRNQLFFICKAMRRWAFFKRAGFPFLETLGSLEEATHVLIKDERRDTTIAQLFQTQKGHGEKITCMEFFKYKGICFIVSREKGTIERAAVVVSGWTPVFEDETIRGALEEMFGRNEIVFKRKILLAHILGEFIAPLSLFQLISVLVWFHIDYEYYAVCILIIMLWSAIESIRTAIKNDHEMEKAASTKTQTLCLRKGVWAEIDAACLVPGDMVEINKVFSIIPADVVLVENSAVVSEEILTGESRSVIKKPTAIENVRGLDLEDADNTKCILLMGTSIMQFGSGKEKVRAVVARTGVETHRGGLFRMLFCPKERRSRFESDMFVLSLVMIFVGVLCSTFSYFLLEKAGLKDKLISRAFDIFLISIPPGLAPIVSAEITAATARISRKGIIAYRPRRLPAMGGVDMVCFDKTGTLTESSIGLEKVVVCASGAWNELGACEWSKAIDEEALHELAHETGPDQQPTVISSLVGMMAACHSIEDVDGILLGGNSLDIALFEESRFWIRNDGEHVFVENAVRKMQILKTLGISVKLRRSGVVISENGLQTVYSKGSPEDMKPLFNADTLPSDYAQRHGQYTAAGLRVVACGARRVSLSAEELDAADRTSLETGLSFLGLICFENPLKARTSFIFDELRRCEIQTKICTGDNPLTALFVARKCKLGGGGRAYISHLVEGDVEWVSQEDNSVFKGPAGDLDVFVCTGKAFERLIARKDDIAVHEMLLRIQVYARMFPEQKLQLVTLLQEAGHRICFCGDGSNDLKALAGCDVGVSLNINEAAGACFVLKSGDVGDVLELLIEGRAVFSSVLCYILFFTMTNLIQMLFVVTTLFNRVFVLDMQYITLDLIIVFFCSLLMTRTPPVSALSLQRPTKRIFCAGVLLSIGGNLLLAGAFQLGLHLTLMQSLGEAETRDGGFILVAFQAILTAVSCSDGRPFKRLLNIPLYAYICLASLFIVGVSVLPDDLVPNLLFNDKPAMKTLGTVYKAVGLQMAVGLLFNFVLLPYAMALRRDIRETRMTLENPPEK
eukprot:GHVN01047081.1.p1 GENE.GHVN01047081.1~~GHVN01047081.1.p1  ORF type:complete len:1040 (-),score=69.54 GHVN01047081.1:3341-6460(-)